VSYLDNTQWILHSGKYTVENTQWKIHSGKYTVENTQWIIRLGLNKWFSLNGFLVMQSGFVKEGIR